MSGASSSLETETEAEEPSHAKNIYMGWNDELVTLVTMWKKAVTAYHKIKQISMEFYKKSYTPQSSMIACIILNLSDTYSVTYLHSPKQDVG